MNSNTTTLVRIAALAASLLALPVLASATETAQTDRAAQQLASVGSVDIKAVGRYVEPGTFRIQVSTKLGRPSTVLADGTWLYSNHVIDGSNATGTLVIRFDDHGQVSQMSLVTPAIATAMAKPQKAPEKVLVASASRE